MNLQLVRLCASLTILVSAASAWSADNTPPLGFSALFNGKDFTGWHAVGTEDPRKVHNLTVSQWVAKYNKDMGDLKEHWKIDNGELVNDGKGPYMTTDKDYGDYELHVEWKLIPHGDSGVYLKGTPQVQIWDYTDADYIQRFKADMGSGGLWNNSAGAAGKDPVTRADKPVGEWNKFRVIQAGARTSVYLNDRLVVECARLENYFDRKSPLVAKGPVQLQTHGNEVRWKNIYVRELSAAEARGFLGANESRDFVQLFNGRDLTGWKGATENYEVVDGAIRCQAGKGGVLHTEKEYGDFIARLEFRLPPGGNNGLAIRYPGEGDTAYVGMCELQILDTEHEKYTKLDPRQAHGSAYGMAAAHRGYLRPTGQWNFQEVTVKGSTIKVELNGSLILDADLAAVTEYLGGKPHAGKDRTSGYFGFAGHNDPVEFRAVRIKELKSETTAAK